MLRMKSDMGANGQYSGAVSNIETFWVHAEVYFAGSPYRHTHSAKGSSRSAEGMDGVYWHAWSGTQADFLDLPRIGLTTIDIAVAATGKLSFLQ